MGVPAPQGVAASGLPPAGDQANAVLSGTLTAVGASQPFAFRGPMNLAIWGSDATTLTTTANSTAASVSSGTGIAAGGGIISKNVPRGTTWATFSGTSGTLALPTVTYPGFVSTAAAQITGLPVTANLAGVAVTGPGIPSGTTVTAVTQAAVPPGQAGTIGGAGFPGTTGTVSLSATPTATTPNNAQRFFSFALTSAAVTGGSDAAAVFTGASATFSATVQLERSFDGGSTWIVCNIGGSGSLAQWTAGTPVSITFGEPEKNVLYRVNCIVYASGTVNYRVSQTGGAAESLAIGPLSGG